MELALAVNFAQRWHEDMLDTMDDEVIIEAVDNQRSHPDIASQPKSCCSIQSESRSFGLYSDIGGALQLNFLKAQKLRIDKFPPNTPSHLAYTRLSHIVNRSRPLSLNRGVHHSMWFGISP